MPADKAVTNVLRLLADCDSTGALEVNGPVTGTIYLVAGRVTAIETAAVPDLATRAVGTVGPPAAADGTGPAGLARSVLLDAATALLSPGGPISPPQFHSGLAGPDMPGSGVGVETLLAHTSSALERLATASVGADDVLALQPLRDRAVRLDPRQWALLAQLDRPRTVRALAWAIGSDLTSTVLALADLVDQDACVVLGRQSPSAPVGAASVGITPVQSGPPALPQAPWEAARSEAARPGTARSEAARPEAARPEPLPRRRPGATGVGEPAGYEPAGRGRTVEAGRPAGRPTARPVAVGGQVTRSAVTHPELPPAFVLPDRDMISRLIDGLRRL